MKTLEEEPEFLARRFLTRIDFLFMIWWKRLVIYWCTEV